MNKSLIFILLFYGRFDNLLFAQQRKPAKPNIIFILSDDQSVPYAGCYGNKDVHTPNIDRLAKEGMLFNHAYTTSPQCTPSRASIFTGRSPVDIRMTRFAAPLAKEIITFPELLRQAGYYTGIVGRYYHLDGPLHIAGETELVYKEHELKTFASRVNYLKIGDNFSALPQFNDFLNQVPGGKPFFVQVGYEDPHYPFTATTFEPDPAHLAIPPGMPDIPETKKFISGHIGLIQRLDSLVGLLLMEIDKRGLSSNTLVVFMGDNGAALLRGKGTLYDAGLHVPLLARWPGQIVPGTVCDRLISGEDIAPTFLDVASVPVPVSITGKSFRNFFSNATTENHEYIFAERGAHGTGLPSSTVDYDESRTIFDRTYKLIYNALWQLPYKPVDFAADPLWTKLGTLHNERKLDSMSERLFFTVPRPMFELFDLRKDPHEFNNLAGKTACIKIERELKAKLQAWMLINQDYLPLPLPFSKDDIIQGQ